MRFSANLNCPCSSQPAILFEGMPKFREMIFLLFGVLRNETSEGSEMDAYKLESILNFCKISLYLWPCFHSIYSLFYALRSITDIIIAAVLNSEMDELAPTEKAQLAFEILVYIVGTIGNLLVLFMIIYLGETRKITHWYVLQLAIADMLYLQTLPIKMIETINHQKWLYNQGLCIAKHVIIYVNYYGSMIFLTVMAIDRYMAVCHGLSKVTQKLRSQRPCYVITILSWIAALLLCIPVIMYSGVFEKGGDCYCGFTFPKDGSIWCHQHADITDAAELEDCLKTDFVEFVLDKPNKCIGESESDGEGSGSGGSGSGSYSGLGSGYSGYGALSDNEAQSDNFTEPPASLTVIPRSFCFHDDQTPAMHTFIILNFTVMFIVPLLIISICYGLIVMRLRKSSARTRSYSERSVENSSSGTEMTRRGLESTRRKQSTSGRGGRHKLKVTVMCAVLVMLFVACWLPFHAVQLAMIDGFFTTKGSCSIFLAATVILTFINSALNPYLYNFLGTFSKRLRDIKKHQRTRSIVESLRWAGTAGRRSRSSSTVPSETAVTRRTEVYDGNKIPKEEIPLRQMHESNDAIVK